MTSRGGYELGDGLRALRAWLLDLLGGLALGDELEGWRLEFIDTDESASYIFVREGARVEIALGPRDDTTPRFAQTRSFNLGYYVARLPGRPLPADAVPFVHAVAALISRNDTGEAGERFARALPADSGGEVREVDAEYMLAPVEIDGSAYYTANPYLGCLIGCRFCYAQARVNVVRKLAGLEVLPWGRYVLAKRNAARILDEELSRVEARPLILSPIVADVYQSVERRLGITRACLEVLARRNVRTYVLTRATLVLRDLDLFRQIEGATVGFSVPTDRDDVRRAYEPRGAPIAARLEALRTLREAGIRTVAVVQPIFALDPERLADQLAAVCDAVRVDYYRASDLDGAPLRPEEEGGPPPPEDDHAVRETLVAALRARGVRIWDSHVPPP